MKKYFVVMKATVAQYMVYRLNFVLWRVRQVMQLLVTYFLWWAIFSQRQQIFGYTQSMMLTYILLTSLARTIVLGTTTMEIGDIINAGDLSNYLIRPLNFFSYFAARDVADKLLNLVFTVVEVALLLLLLHPPLFLQTDPRLLVLTFLGFILGAALYFNFSILLGLIGFWTPDTWAPRFLSTVIIEFFAGGLFPLDILPRPLFLISNNLPFSYFIYFPLKIYLGQLQNWSIITGFSLAVGWLMVLGCLMLVIWHRGLRIYTAQGR